MVMEQSIAMTSVSYTHLDVYKRQISALPQTLLAWDYAQLPLNWYSGVSPNLALVVDDSTSMHYQVVNDSYQRVKAGVDSFTINSWYVCTGYNLSLIHI